jgi:DNA-binding transcriptional MerR regulator
MPTIYRRAHLLAVIRRTTGTWNTQRAERVLANSSWGCHRNTARKDLRALAARGLLTAHTTAEGRRVYTAADVEDGER